ncbi:MAG TPA: hypothetical protein VIT62_09945 [Lysobacter sp.]
MTTADSLMPLQAEPPTNRQRLFVLYYSAILIDLVVLNLFNEFSDKVHIESFTVSLMVAVVLQVLLKLTIALEHYVAAYFKARPGGFMTFMRWFSAWLILFGSKFVILEAISFAFGTDVHFDGRWHGLLVLITVIVVMLLAEELIVRLYRRLG